MIGAYKFFSKFAHQNLKKMRNKIFIIATIFTLAFISCKKEEKAKEGDAAATVEQVKNFRVDLDVYTEKDDNFSVYYTEDNTINFTGEKAIWAGVKGKQDQKVTLNLPEEVIPTDVRIDFGLKTGDEQGDVTLKNFKFEFFGKTFERKGSEFLNYFIKNDSIQTEIDAQKGTITFKKNPKSKMTPFYYPQQTVIDEIKKMTN